MEDALLSHKNEWTIQSNSAGCINVQTANMVFNY